MSVKVALRIKENVSECRGSVEIEKYSEKRTENRYYINAKIAKSFVKNIINA